VTRTIDRKETETQGGVSIASCDPFQCALLIHSNPCWPVGSDTCVILFLIISIQTFLFWSPFLLGALKLHCKDGKQFATTVSKKGNIPTKVLFQKDTKFGPFGQLQEAINYRNAKRDKGFGTSDASKRDEFTSNMVTEQYRGLLNTEKMHQRRTYIGAKEVGKVQYNDRLGELVKQLEAKEQEYHELLGRTTTLNKELHRNGDRTELFQYDYGRKQFTDFNPKKYNDTFYNFNRTQGKRYGKAHSTTYQHGMVADGIVGAPKKIDSRDSCGNFAHEATTETFFNNGHLGCDSTLG
jgi:hypothetical protein